MARRKPLRLLKVEESRTPTAGGFAPMFRARAFLTLRNQGSRSSSRRWVVEQQFARVAIRHGVVSFAFLVEVLPPFKGMRGAVGPFEFSPGRPRPFGWRSPSGFRRARLAAGGLGFRDPSVAGGVFAGGGGLCLEKRDPFGEKRFRRSREFVRWLRCSPSPPWVVDPGGLNPCTPAERGTDGPVDAFPSIPHIKERAGIVRSMALGCAPPGRRRDLAPAARRVRAAQLGVSLPVRRHHLLADHAAAARRLADGDRHLPGHAAAAVHGPGRPLRILERHGLADRGRVPVRARVRPDAARRADRLHHRQERRPQPASPGLFHRAGGPGDGADDAVQHGARRRGPVSDHVERREGLRVGAGSRRPAASVRS